MSVEVIGGISWFPQHYAELFYIAKMVLGIVSTALVVVHMTLGWNHVVENGTPGQRMRYYVLLWVSFLLASGSAEQYHDGITVSYRNLGGMILALLIIGAMSVSIVEDIKRKRAERTDKS